MRYMQPVEVSDLARIIWRWRWMIIILTLITVGGLLIRAMRDEPVYSASVNLFVSTPDREDISVSEENAYIDFRDLTVAAINNFVEIAQYAEVKTRTQADLNITTDYQVEVEAERGIDFIHITVYADTPELAQQIADTHTQNALAYYGELRALPTKQAQTFFTMKLDNAKQALVAAQNALVDFQITHNIIALDSEITIAERVLEELELNSARASLLNTVTSEESPPAAIESLNTQDSIDAQRLYIANLNQLKPEYDHLIDNIARAQTTYDTLSKNLTNTQLRASFTSQTIFVQIIEHAEQPTSPWSNTIQTVIMGGTASLGLSILLAFFLDYLKHSWSLSH